jgi:SET domain-containing protein
MTQPKIILRKSAVNSQGIFAVDLIKKDEHIITFTGHRYHYNEVDFNNYHLQIDEQLYLGPSGELDDYLNHSCNPNSGFRDGLELFALVDIPAGEEVTWDYSTAIDEADFPGFPCSCGSVRCRQIVKSFRDLSPSEQQHLFPHLLPYLKRKYLATIPKNVERNNR